MRSVWLSLFPRTGSQNPEATGDGKDGQVVPRHGGLNPLLGGVLAAAALLVSYLAIVGSASCSLEHALDLMWHDRYYILAILAGFGTQVGLMGYIRRTLHGIKDRTSTAAGATGTGTSTASMIACCAHHVADFAPFLGASGLVIFLNNYRYQVMLIGIAINWLGVAVLLRRMAIWGILPRRLLPTK